MEIVLTLLAVGGALVGARSLRDRRSARRSHREELETVRRFALEDVVLLGEELRRLDARTAGHPLDPEGQVDYQTALDAYESAGRTAERLEDPQDVSRVVDAVTSGRFALARVQARVDGRPLPTERTPCFFNPQHGPATGHVTWTRPGHGTRRVPVCALDAARHAAGDDPEVRYLEIGGRKVPYWEAGHLLQPYARGYFPTSVTDGRRDGQAMGRLYDPSPPAMGFFNGT